MAIEADAEDDSARVTAAAIRKAKKESRPTKISEPMAKPAGGKDKSKKKSRGPVKAGGDAGAGGKKKRGSAFDDDKGQKRGGGGGHEGMRAQRVKVNLSKSGTKKPRSKK